MNFNGGVIIIGSLLWDNAKRAEWRQRSLKPIETKTPVPLRIRYGRESDDRRHHTYTMIFSNHPTTEFGQGYIVGFNKVIENPEILERQAFALAKAEGISADHQRLLSKSWGAVGLLVNPEIDSKDKIGGEIIRSSWTHLFQNYGDSHDPLKFRIGDEAPVIDNDGFLHIDWTTEMNAFDFLIATPVVPKPKKPLIARTIAERMIQKEYTEYFDKNRVNNITTFQDDEIFEYLRR